MDDDSGNDEAVSANENKRIEQFLDAVADVEKKLKRKLKLKADDQTALRLLINDYVSKNRYWSNDAEKLRQFTGIRNLLTHERSSTEGYPVIVTGRSLYCLQNIVARLSHPELVSKRFSREVVTVSFSDPLTDTLQQAYEREFSQFPVFDRGRFRGLLTENGITRWMGRHVMKFGVGSDLKTVTVGDVLKEEEKKAGRKGQIFEFCRADAPAEEVIEEMFAARPLLEAVLITETGGRGTAPLLGMVTEWDASRYSAHA